MKRSARILNPSHLDGRSKERRFQRTGCDLPARYIYEGRAHYARITTISAGGAYLACNPREVELNRVLELEFELDGELINAISRLVWINRGLRNHLGGGLYAPGFAVEYERLSAEARAKIDAFVKRSLRILRALSFELSQRELDREKISHLFLSLRPGDSLHLNHIRKVVKQELRHYRLRKDEYSE